MTDPATIEEYNARHRANLRFEGFGLEAISHLPCPFCAAPDFMVFKLLDSTSAFEAGATCGECGRSMRAVIRRGRDITMDIVQTGGPDPAPCMPKMRREGTRR